MKKTALLLLAALLLSACNSGGKNSSDLEVSSVMSEETSQVLSETSEASPAGNSSQAAVSETASAASSQKTSTPNMNYASDSSAVSSKAPVNHPVPPSMADLKKALTVKPTITYVPSLNYSDSVKAAFYTGMSQNGKSVRVFCYIGFPVGASAASKVPAVVLVHGGGGQAFPQWVEEWTKRGYAAIAMDNYGNMPGTGTGGAFVKDTMGGPMYDEYNSIDQPIDTQWMYHAVCDAILANNVLRADDRVDVRKIGITGISWGGIITGLTIGADSRFAFAVPVYGCGFLSGCKTYFSDIYKKPKVAEYWGVENFAPFADMPVLWLNSDGDGNFPLDSFSKTAAVTPGSALTIKPSLAHGHIEGWEPDEIYAFADKHCKKGSKGLAVIKSQPQKSMGRNVTFDVDPAGNAIHTVRVFYTTAPLSYSAGRPNTLTSVFKFVDGTYSNGKASVTLPADAHSYYVNVITNDNGKAIIASTQFVVLK